MNQPARSIDSDEQDGDTLKTELRCTVVSLVKSDGPGGETEGDWYRYVIEAPGSPITGYRRGKKSDVLEYLEECIQTLEDRLNTRKSRSPARQGNRVKTTK